MDNDAILTPVNDAVPGATYERIFDPRARLWCANCGVVGGENFASVTCHEGTTARSLTFKCNVCHWTNRWRAHQ